MDKISDLKKIIIQTLDINKALDIVSIDLKDKSSMAEYMIIASGTSSRHIQSLSEQVLEKFKDYGMKDSKIEGKDSTEWKLVDGIDLIVHIFCNFNMKARSRVVPPVQSRTCGITRAQRKGIWNSTPN